MSVVLEYRSNNSGGSWWLSDDDWRALEKAGWIVHWVHERDDPSHTHAEEDGVLSRLSHHHGYTDPLVPARPNGERYLRALAVSAAKECEDVAATVQEWATITGQDPSAVGCNCCGEPHSFSYRDAEGGYHYSSAEVTATELSWE